MMNTPVTIAIIGGGFSGICTAIHLIENANSPLTIYLIEKESKLCQGIAYGTKSPHHLLNVRAGRMGALAKKADDFYIWLEKHPDLWQSLDPTFPSLNITWDSYLPRKLYAAYLQDLFGRALETAKKKKIVCTVIYDKAIDASLDPEGQVEVILSQNNSLLVDYLVLATGTPPNQIFSFETSALLANPHYIHNIWDFDFESRLYDLCAENEGKGKQIAIIGSGLTTIDALFTLHAMNYQGTLHLISKNGAFPQVHQEILVAPSPNVEVKDFPKSLTGIVSMFRYQFKNVDATNIDWRQWFDAIRPWTQEIWQSLPISAKKQFMRHLFSWWNKHRHRMPPRSHEVLEFFKINQALTLTAGIVQNVVSLHNQKLKVVYQERKTGASHHIEADCVINCSGPDYKIVNHGDPLIQNLLKKQIVLSEEMGLGLKISQKEMLAGKGNGKIFAIGALLFGERFETTAVPELRQQAHSIADTILFNSKEID